MFLLKKGTYYLGDPCYVIPNSDWDRFIDQLGSDQSLFKFDGFECYVSSTKYGDGEYPDNFGNYYTVDAGIIGAIPIQLVENPDNVDYGKIVQMQEDFVCNFDGNSIIIGPYRISVDYTEELVDEEKLEEEY